MVQHVLVLYSFLRWDNILSNICTTICSSVDGQLGYLHLLTIVNGAAVNTFVPILVLVYIFSVLLDIYLGVEFLHHMGFYVWLFEETPNCFPPHLYQFASPPANLDLSIS